MHLLPRASTVLVVIDVQERLLRAFPDDVRTNVVRQVSTLVEAAVLLGLPTLVTEQYPAGLGPTVSDVRHRLGDAWAPIEKVVFSCARSAPFRAALGATGRRDVLLAGVEAHVCALQTTVDLLADGYHVFVAADAVGSRRAFDAERGLALMDRAGAVVGTTEMFLFQLLERAGTDEFRRVAKLLK